MDGSWDTVASGLTVIAVMGVADREFTHERPLARPVEWWSRSTIATLAAKDVGSRAAAPLRRSERGKSSDEGDVSDASGAKKTIDGSLSTQRGRHEELSGAAFPHYSSPTRCLRQRAAAGGHRFEK